MDNESDDYHLIYEQCMQVSRIAMLSFVSLILPFKQFHYQGRITAAVPAETEKKLGEPSSGIMLISLIQTSHTY